MRRLIIDTATENCSVALFDGEQLLATTAAMLGRGHAEALLPMVAGLPDKGRAAHIHVNCGPGSFTGIRVGIAAGRALGYAWGCQISGYDNMALLAAMAISRIGSAVPIDVAILGGHGEYFVQRFDMHGKSASPLFSMFPVNAGQFLDGKHIVGNASTAIVAVRNYGVAHNIWPDASSALVTAKLTTGCKPEPIYGRNADAKPMQSVL